MINISKYGRPISIVSIDKGANVSKSLLGLIDGISKTGIRTYGVSSFLEKTTLMFEDNASGSVFKKVQGALNHMNIPSFLSKKSGVGVITVDLRGEALKSPLAVSAMISTLHECGIDVLHTETAEGRATLLLDYADLDKADKILEQTYSPDFARPTPVSPRMAPLEGGD